MAEATNATAKLISGNWLDVLTRAIFLELLVYNPNTALYTSSACVFEYFTSGGFFPTILFSTMELDVYSGAYGIASIVLQIIFFVFISIFVGIIITRIIQQKNTYIKVR